LLSKLPRSRRLTTGGAQAAPVEDRKAGRSAMNRTSQEWLAQGAASVARRAAGEFLAILPAVLFFFIALMVVLVMLKLFISEYSIEFYAFSKAAIGALILGKVVLLMDWAESGHRASTFPRAAVIAFKTLIYGLAVLALGIGERVFHSYRRAGDFPDAFRIVIANANLARFLGCVLLISLLVSAYLAMKEISRAMGKGALFSLFFKTPAHIGAASQAQ
jgi:fumarate reductase subunit D